VINTASFLRSFIAACAAFAALSACAVEDADLSASPAVVSIEASASTDQLADRTTHITGSVELGYTSSQMVQLSITDADTEVYSAEIAGGALVIPIDATVDLVQPGANELVVSAGYNGQTAGVGLIVTVPGALQSLSLTPGASAVSTYQVTVSGEVAAGYHSSVPALLQLRVDGAVVHAEELDFSTALTAAYDTVIPLGHDGPNEVVAEVAYGGESLSQRVTVAASAAAPTLAFPSSWADSYDPGNPLAGKTLSGALDVTPAAGYSVDAVTFSVDGGPWLPASGSDPYTIDIVDPDIGDVGLKVRVDSSVNGHHQTTEFAATVAVVPEFDCDAPALSMTPDNDLYQDIGVNYRTMLGYFGHADSGHTVSFFASGTFRINDTTTSQVEIVSSMVTYGTTTALVSFDVGRVSCANPPCDTDYHLTAVVDGAEVCSDTLARFGRIRNLN